ncbi:MAG: carbamoyl-phosphate synthase domain-containing protein, partial [Pseudomonadota bacterium]|nr:carbamoyl-phosphate synthase domain-containing protein [Pseudomonadota bacterium]
MADNAATAKDLPTVVPEGATGVLVLADGSVIWGHGIGAHGSTVGEICFNTSITGYQEILTDPSYAGQIINFTFPHIGNVGTNLEDNESTTPAARGLILRAEITNPSNWRARKNLDEWLKSRNLIGIAGVDTRSLTRRIRDCGAPIGVICNAMKSDSPDIDAHFSGKFTLNALLNSAKNWPGLEGMDLAKEVTCNQPYNWDETLW